MEGVGVMKRNHGVVFLPNGQTEINVWSPDSEKVEIKLTGGKKYSLSKVDHGYWHLLTEELKANEYYTFVLNGEKEVPDPASLLQPEGVHGPSLAIDLTFNWTDHSWNNIPLDQYIIYELHTGTFTNEGTFSAIESKLDHLLELGVNAIEIMPVAQFPGERNWGYDGVYPYAVQYSYGGPVGLQHLVNRCHEKGIAVILDVVYNHLGPEGNYLGSMGPFFTSKYKTPWGDAINFDDAWCNGVRNYFIENALMWFREFHIDALRLDAVHAIKDMSPVHLLKDLKLSVNKLMEHTGKHNYLIVEMDLNDNRYINPLDKCGYGMDAQWLDEFHHALRVTSGGEKNGYYSDFKGVEDLAKAYVDAYVFDGQWSPHRKKNFGIKANNKGSQFIVFTQNHDHIGNRMLGERTSQLVSFEMQKLMIATVLVSPYLPMIFMGEEWMETNPFLYFVSHTDPALAEAVRKGRKQEFAAFHCGEDAPDPMAEETFLRSKINWDLISEKKHKTMFAYYKYLIDLRKKHPLLKQSDRNRLKASCNKENNTLILTRWNESIRLNCFMNFSNRSADISSMIPEGSKILMDSSSPEWGEIDSTSCTVLNSESIKIFESPTK
ncbi:MAG: malto-oligosyltrehalose trehalohydrolase [Flavisolibacter sp.]